MNNLVVTLTSLILATAIPLSSPLIAEAQSNFNLTGDDRSIDSNENIIYVNPKTGDDRIGKGSDNSPLKTITQALLLAKPKTIIQLAPGTYSKDTGESFPIIIRSDVTLKGSPAAQGYNVIIQGSGTFLSATAAGQHVAVAAIRDAGEITGVTIINPENRGYGLWIESANPRVIGNTFTRNGNTGLSVNGNSSPQITNNYFYNNMGNGLTVYDTSKPEIRDNLFEKTGFAITITENTEASIVNNRFNGNRIGILLQGQSKVSLRDNTIEKSSESGLVAIANTQVDLGTSSEPGGNIFRNNSKLALQNAGKGQIIGFGNQISGRTEGKMDLTGNSKIASTSSQSSTAKLPPLPISRGIVGSTIVKPTESNSLSSNSRNFPQPLLSASPIRSSSGEKELVFTAPGSNPPLPTRSPSTSSSLTTIDRDPIDTEAGTETLPPPPEIKDPGVDNFDNGNLDRLPAPNLSDSPQSDSLAINSSTRGVYRVIVEATSSDRQAQVKSLYPEAFSTLYLGKPVLQVGVFSDRSKAEKVLDSLQDLGVTGTIAQ
jgi:parallel beta-helix repeat protein